MGERKSVRFAGGALDDLRLFPDSARRDAGHQIDLVQQGIDPDDWKPMTNIGGGVREIRVRDSDSAFRVIYVATFVDAVFILHCFQKKTQKTANADIALARARYRRLLKDNKS